MCKVNNIELTTESNGPNVVLCHVSLFLWCFRPFCSDSRAFYAHTAFLNIENTKQRTHPMRIWTIAIWSEFELFSSQIIRFERNPHYQEPGIIPRNVSAVDITFWHNNDTKMKISNLSTPIRVVFSRKLQETPDQDLPDDSLFLRRKEMRYHSFLIPYYEAVVTVRIKPEKNISLRVYVKHDSRPTAQQHDFNVTLPNTALPSCSNNTREWNSTCSPRDPYEFDLLPNVTGHVGRHFLGIEIVEHSLTGIIGNDGNLDKLALRRKKQSCVKVKPPPPTPLPVKKDLPHIFNSKTDVKYKLFVTVGTCVFWNELREKWSIRGCQVS